MSTNPVPVAEMPLLDFLICHYMQTIHYTHNAPPNIAVLRKGRQVCRHLGEVLGRKAVVGDLSQTTWEKLKTFYEAQGRRPIYIKLSYGWFAAVWRFAADLGITLMPVEISRRKTIRNRGKNGEQVVLSVEPGTLWHICLHDYFPKSLSIRSEKTRMQYKLALRDFKEYLGHDPTLADLTDDHMAGYMLMSQSKGRESRTTNERRGRITALWNWLAKRRVVETFPTIGKLPEPKRIPQAWTRNDMAKLLDACRHVGGKIGNVWWADWWIALHLVLWDTGARIGEVLKLRWEWVNWETGHLPVPAEVRKGGQLDMLYQLNQETLDALKRIRGTGELIFPFPFHEATLYNRYKRIRKAAGLALDPKSAFHRIRRSVASHVHAAGFNATDVLKHSSADLTRRAYLDPAIIGAVSPANVLFRPDGKAEDIQLPEEQPLDPSLAFI